MDEDSTWVFNAPQHYCDLPSAVNDDDSEQADQYFLCKFPFQFYFWSAVDFILFHGG